MDKKPTVKKLLALGIDRAERELRTAELQVIAVASRDAIRMDVEYADRNLRAAEKKLRKLKTLQKKEQRKWS